MGVDLGGRRILYKTTTYVEKLPQLVALANHNFAILNPKVEVYNDDAEAFLEQMSPVDVIYIDPARRDTKGQKTVSIHDCTPDVSFLQQNLLEKAYQVLIKLSPMLDISLALSDLRHVKSVHVVSFGNECKSCYFFFFFIIPMKRRFIQSICHRKIKRLLHLLFLKKRL